MQILEAAFGPVIYLAKEHRLSSRSKALKSGKLIRMVYQDGETYETGFKSQRDHLWAFGVAGLHSILISCKCEFDSRHAHHARMVLMVAYELAMFEVRVRFPLLAPICGCGITVECHPSKLEIRVRLPTAALWTRSLTS